MFSLNNSAQEELGTTYVIRAVTGQQCKGPDVGQPK